MERGVDDGGGVGGGGEEGGGGRDICEPVNYPIQLHLYDLSRGKSIKYEGARMRTKDKLAYA